ncbi:MAG: hypothetical protein D6698_09860 [Gammaproteobacteria bacterium]|nr:MAG: hypothetical protein D6698_09860 [Gammaproteobacteria bacterium]
MRILNPNESYTFSKFFDLNAEADDIVADFGYSLSREKLNLPVYSGELGRLQELRDRIEEILPFVNLTTEIARREILISRVVTEVVHYTQAQLRIEYPLKVSEQLQGSLDYLLRTDRQIIVIEAKKEDLTNGIKQLAVEMIALDQWMESPQKQLIGAVTTGSLWQFSQLDRETQRIHQGLESYRVPEDLDTLLRILVQALLA